MTIYKTKDGKQIALTEAEIIEYNEKQSDEHQIKYKIRNGIANREAYLNSTDWYISREADQPNSYPQEIKDKRILARTEINQIEQETDINNIVIEFNQ